MPRQPHTCLRPLRAHIPASSTQRQALAALERPDFDPDQGYEWPAQAPEVETKRPAEGEAATTPSALGGASASSIVSRPASAPGIRSPPGPNGEAACCET